MTRIRLISFSNDYSFMVSLYIVVYKFYCGPEIMRFYWMIFHCDDDALSFLIVKKHETTFSRFDGTLRDIYYFCFYRTKIKLDDWCRARRIELVIFIIIFYIDPWILCSSKLVGWAIGAQANMRISWNVIFLI